MLSLGDFNDPWNFRTVGLFLLVLLSFDTLGFFLRRKAMINGGDEYRQADWLWGLAFFSFCWFVIGYFVPPYGWLVTTTVVLTPLGFGVFYWKNSAFRKLGQAWFQCLPYLLVFSPFFLAFGIKSSLPPYYSDEMAYHFVSPAYLLNLKTFDWYNLRDFSVFNFIPKTLDVIYVIFFSMAKTNAISRGIQALVLFTVFATVGRVFRPRFGIFFSLMFIFLYLSIPQSLVMDTTVGFVDVPSVNLRFMGIALGILALYESNWRLFLLSMFSWTLALATKYSTMTGFFSFVVVALIYLYFFNRQFLKTIFSKVHLIRLGIVIFFAGGFWYVKNLIVTGNPVFPFVLPCYRFKDYCGKGSEFFGNWTKKISFDTLDEIYMNIFSNQKHYLYLILIALGVACFKSRKQIRIFAVMILAAIALEFVLLSKTSGFYLRYHQHVQYFLVFLATLPFAAFLNGTRKAKVLVSGLALVSVLIVGSGFRDHVRQTYESHMAPAEKQYFWHEIDIYQFVDHRFKGRKAFIQWCEQNKVLVQRYDPDLIWYDDAAYIHQYMTNCFFGGQEFPIEASQNEVVELALKNKTKAYIFSANACVPQAEVKKKFDYEDEASLKMRKVNNILICCAQPVGSMIYLLDYEKLQCPDLKQ